jgi:hypothetical protein
VKRRPYGRDLGLSIRMAIALVPIVLWYLLVGGLLVLMAYLLAQGLAELSREVGKAA